MAKAEANAMFTITDTGDLSGRNLIQRSFFLKDPWTGPNKNATGGGFGTYHDKYCLPVFASWLYSNTGGNTHYYTLFPDLTFLEGQQYTFSGKALEDRTDDKHTGQIFKFFYTDGTHDDARPIAVDGETNVWVDFVFTTAAGKTLQKISDTYGNSGYTYFADLKLEVGAAATEWTPAPEDMNTAMGDIKAAQSTADNAQSTANNAQSAANAADTKASTALETATGAVTAINDYIAGNEIVVGTQTASTSHWTGAAGFKELKDGQKITYWLPVASTSTAVDLNLTLADGETTTGAIPVFYRSTTRATTHFAPNCPVTLNYRENVKIGSDTYNGWWADVSYYVNSVDRLQHVQPVKIKTGFTTDYPFIVSDDDGYFMLAPNVPFNVTKAILYYNSTATTTSGGTTTAGFIAISQCNLCRNKSDADLAVNASCYIEGSLNGSTFTPSANLFTDTPVDDQNGYYYLLLGYVTSKKSGAVYITLYPEHPIFKFVNGVFKSLNQVAYEANVLASEAKSTAESKNSVYYQATAPTAHKVGDTWFDTTNDGYRINKWNGTAWEPAQLRDDAVANLSASKITAGSIMSNVILGGTIQAGGSAVGQTGKVLVKDVNDTEVASLSKDGLVATAGSIGGWTITDKTIESVVLDTSVTPNVRSTAHLSSEYGTILLSKGDHSVDIYPDHISQQSTISAAADEPRIYIANGDITYSNVYMPVPNETIMSFRKWTTVSPARTIKGPLQVTVYHCMNLFWAHFFGTIPAGWNISNTQDVFLPIITGDTDLSNSVNVAPPLNITKFIIPSDPTNRRISVVVRSDGQLGISRVAEPLKGDASATIAGYIETCDIFWAHVE